MSARISVLEKEYDAIKVKADALIASISGSADIPFENAPWTELTDALIRIAVKLRSTSDAVRMPLLRESVLLLQLRLFVLGPDAAFRLERLQLGIRNTILLGTHDEPERESEFWDRWFHELSRAKVTVIAPRADEIMNYKETTEDTKGSVKGLVEFFDRLLIFVMKIVLKRTATALDTLKRTLLHEMRAKEQRTTGFIERVKSWLVLPQDIGPASDDEIQDNAVRELIEFIKNDDVLRRDGEDETTGRRRMPNAEETEQFIATINGKGTAVDGPDVLGEKQRAMLALLQEMAHRASNDLAMKARGERSAVEIIKA
jgi:hypothetical protein